jgi:FdrA protein
MLWSANPHEVNRPVPIAGVLRSHTYRDSVALMVLTSALAEYDGVRQASAMMGTPANLEILRATGLFADAFVQAGPNDLCIAIDAADGAVAVALAQAEVLLADARGGSALAAGGSERVRPRTLTSALRVRPSANLALVSVPGAYAAHEAQSALLAGLHVFLFSDNVPLTDEVALKTLATARGLLMMGPDCGTALIGGVPLGFANLVRRGPIGVVGSSGTGLQEVTSLIHRLGGGVSHAIGTGSRDLYAEVGGRTFLAAIDALVADSGTEVIVAIAKPGAPDVQARVSDRLTDAGKQAVVYFLGGQASAKDTAPPGLVVAADLEHAARCAIALASGQPPPLPPDPSEHVAAVDRLVSGLGSTQLAVRGLFAGGTLAQEAAAAIARALSVDAPLVVGEAPGEVLRVGPHQIVDLGDDAYTRGRPHPLIDPRLRNAELVAQATTGEVALFLLDVVLGTGAHVDPAAVLAPALEDARLAARAAGADLRVLAALCGTEDDPQGYERQRAELEAAGVVVARSSSAAATIAAQVAARLTTVSAEVRA